MSHKWDSKNIIKNPIALILALAVLSFGAYSMSHANDTQVAAAAHVESVK